MKDFFKVELTCPYCKKKFQYNILSYKAVCECPHCEYRLVVRTKVKVSSAMAILGFILLMVLSQLVGIRNLSFPFDLLIICAACLIYVPIAYAIVCRIKGPESVYIVDMVDPTILERKNRSNKK